MDQIIKEVTETELQPNKKKGEDNLVFIRPWKHFIPSLNEWTKSPHKD
jgi:hypothetical protein